MTYIVQQFEEISNPRKKTYKIKVKKNKIKTAFNSLHLFNAGLLLHKVG
jgi:hypothetical protein